MKYVVAILILGTVAALVMTAASKIRRFSRTVFGTEDIAEGIKRIKQDVSETPKSVSGMTRLMEPQIQRDFPEFVWEQFRPKAEQLLKTALGAIGTQNIELLDENASPQIRQKVKARIDLAKASGEKEHFDNVSIYQTQISNYTKNNGKCVISIQSAVGYYYYKTKDEKVILGTKEYMKQTKYNIELVYIQDETLIDKQIAGNAIGTVCPNCGAPVTSLGAKHCEYCGMAVETINIKVWSLNDFYEVDYNHA